MSGDNDETREFEPTERRLDDARRKGEIPRSPDLNAAAALGGLVLALALLGPWMAERGGNALAGLMAAAPLVPASAFHTGAGTAGAALWPAVATALPLFAVPAVAVLGVLLVQRGLTASSDKLVPRLDRIDPFRALRQKFGAGGLFDFARSTVKLAAVAALLVLYLSRWLPDLATAAQSPVRPGLVLMLRALGGFLAVAAGLGAAIGLIDWFWQRFRHRSRLRMSRQEMKEELRQSEGDPQLKQQRRQKAYDIATNRMLLEVPKAEVVIVNPTHFAVALSWDRQPGRAPVCVAKGVDEVAARIRERAMQAGVPIHSDPPTARALFASVDLGQEIRPDHYRTVAAAIRFAESMRRRARARR